MAPQLEASVQESEQVHLPAAGADRTSPAPIIAPVVLIILAQTSVTTLSDLNDKAIVIAGLTSISLAAVNTALSVAGARNVKLTEGTKNDIDELLDGKVSAAVVDCVTSAKALSFPDIVAGLRVLRVTVTDPGANLVLDK